MAQVHEHISRWEYRVQVSERPVHRHKPQEIQEFLDQFGVDGYELVMFEWEMTVDRMLFAILRRPLT